MFSLQITSKLACAQVCTHVHTHTANIYISITQFALHHSSHLKLGKLLSLVTSILCIDELGEEELVELKALRKANMETEGEDNECL